MNSPIETVRIDARGRNQLSTLKRRTGIENWNIICRWAFCTSIAEPSSPRPDVIGSETGVEMTWRTFGGEYADVYLGILKQRCQSDDLELTQENLGEQLRAHIHRGIGYLLSSCSKDSGVSDIIKKAI